MWRRVLETIKRWTWAYVRVVQRILITVLLTLLYVAGFPLTLLFMLLFSRHALRESAPGAPSFWRAAEGYEISATACNQQS